MRGCDLGCKSMGGCVSSKRNSEVPITPEYSKPIDNIFQNNQQIHKKSWFLKNTNISKIHQLKLERSFQGPFGSLEEGVGVCGVKKLVRFESPASSSKMGMSKVSQIPQQNSAIKNKPFILKRVSLPNNKDKSNSPLAMRKSSHFDKVEIKNTETVPIKEVVPEKVNEKLSIVEMRRRFFESTFDHSPITIPNVDRISPNLTKSENLTKTVNILEKQINPTVNPLKEKESIEKQVFTPLSRSRIPLRTPNRTLTYERKPFYTLLMTSPPSKLPLSFNSRIIAKNFNQIQNNTFLVHNHIHSHTLKSVTPTVLQSLTSHPQNSITNSELDENNEIAPCELVDEIKLEVPPSEERVIDSQQSTSYCPSETSSNSSNYLIDDEISDQPQLTFTFKHFNKSDFSRSMISLGSECCSSIESIQSLIFDNNSDNNIQSNNDNSFLIARNSLNEKSKSQKSPQKEPSPEKLCEMLTSEISELRLTLEKLKNVLEEQEKREKAKDLLLQQLIKAFTHQQLS